MRKVKLGIQIGTPSGGTILVHQATVELSPTAGLVVHPEFLCVDGYTNKIIRRRNRWVITHYPSGLAAFKDIPTKADALEIIANHMSHLNWVGMTGNDAVKSNPAEDISSMVKAVREHCDRLNTARKKK